MAIELTKKYQKKLAKVMKLVDIITSTLAVSKTSISKVLNNGRVDEREFTMLQTFHLEALNDLSNIDCKMEAETRTELQKDLLEEINDLKKAVKKSKCLMRCTLFTLCYLMCYHTALKMDELQSICY